MHCTVQHTRFFRAVYRSPQQRYVLGRVYISIEHGIAVVASKCFSFSLTDMKAMMTHFTCVGGRDNHQFYTSKQAFVSKELSELAKAPSTYTRSKFLSLFIGRKPYPLQVLNSDPLVFFFSDRYNFLADGMIDNCGRSSFFARKPFQDFFRAFRAFALKRTPHLLSFFSIFIKFVGRKCLPVAECCNLKKAHVNANKFFHVINVFFSDIYSLKKIKLSLFINQISLAFDVRKVCLIMANKINLLPSSDAPQRNRISLPIRHYSTVVGNAAEWFKNAFRSLVRLIGIGNLSNLAYHHLGRYIIRGHKAMINLVMQFKRIEYPSFPGNIRNSITHLISLLNGFKKNFFLILGWQELYFQCQFHNANIILSNNRRFVTRNNAKAGAFLSQSLRHQWVSCAKIL